VLFIFASTNGTNYNIIEFTNTHKCVIGTYFGGLILIKRETDGKWLAKCDICQWKTLEPKRLDAENKLSNHISIVHRKGKRSIKEQKLPISPDKLPPNLPSPIKEN